MALPYSIAEESNNFISIAPDEETVFIPVITSLESPTPTPLLVDVIIKMGFAFAF
jgi:hypothetical protein